MLKFGVNLDRRFHSLLRRLPTDCTDMLKRTTAESGMQLYQAMDAHCPERPGGGALRRALGFKMSASGLTAFVGYSKRQFPAQWKLAGWRAHFTEFGTKGTASAGQTVKKRFGWVAIRHRHPPTRAQPFILPALRDNIEEIIELQTEAVREALDRASDGA